MKKTLILTLDYPPQIGGIATYVHQMAQALDPAKTVVYAPSEGDTSEWDKSVGYNVLRHKPFLPAFIFPRWLKMYFQIKKIIKQEGIEIILINHVLQMGVMARMIKKFIKIPYVIISHGTDVSMKLGKGGKNKKMRNIVAESEQVIFNSESLKRRFLRIMPDFEEKSTVLYPCPDTMFLTPPPAEEIEKLRTMLALQGKKVMLTISRIDDGKGFPHLVRAMPGILKREPHLVWVIIGDGPKKQEILADIQKHSLQNVVRFIGKVPHKELNAYYHLADLFALFTHPDDGMEEGMGLVFLEAAAAGLPIVAGKSGGVEEAILHTQTGIVIDVYAQAMAMEDAIVQLIQNTDYAQQLGNSAQLRIKTDFQWEHQLKILEPFIGNIYEGSQTKG